MKNPGDSKTPGLWKITRDFVGRQGGGWHKWWCIGGREHWEPAPGLTRTGFESSSAHHDFKYLHPFWVVQLWCMNSGSGQFGPESDVSPRTCTSGDNPVAIARHGAPPQHEHTLPMLRRLGCRVPVKSGCGHGLILLTPHRGQFTRTLF